LSDAGLGCPDWPGCYGRLVVPQRAADVAAANAAYPERPLEAGKAWKEMVHRYAAAALGLLLIVGAVLTWRRREALLPRAVPAVLAVLVILQGLLGMWTVSLLLKPLVVVAHLIGGLSILALIGWCFFRTVLPPTRGGGLPITLVAVGLCVLAAQIFLGGWTSANYAALACPDLPVCQGRWWPPADFAEAFVLWRGLGINYEYGVLESPARTAIHLSHRLGAVVSFCVIGALAIAALRTRHPRVRWAGALVFLALLVQVSLGVLNIKLGLPLAIAVSHNGVAALLLLSMIYLLHCLVPVGKGIDR
jgi:cytochrome c oxidase assembly protein subunit 15